MDSDDDFSPESDFEVIGMMFNDASSRYFPFPKQLRGLEDDFFEHVKKSVASRSPKDAKKIMQVARDFLKQNYPSSEHTLKRRRTK